MKNEPQLEATFRKNFLVKEKPEETPIPTQKAIVEHSETLQKILLGSILI